MWGHSAIAAIGRAVPVNHYCGQVRGDVQIPNVSVRSAHGLIRWYASGYAHSTPLWGVRTEGAAIAIQRPVRGEVRKQNGKARVRTDTDTGQGCNMVATETTIRAIERSALNTGLHGERLPMMAA